MLQESRLYSFIDQKNGFTLHFLEGQKLIKDLAIIHAIHGSGFSYFRDAILSIQLMVAYLKPGEGLGVYLDSEDPYFRLKVEMSEQGQMRTLLLPENFNMFPKSITGKCRVVKTVPNESHPYTSIIELKAVSFNEVMNQVLHESYQLKSKIFISDDSDQSILLMKLPDVNVNSVKTEYPLKLEEYWENNKSAVFDIFKKHTCEYEEIQKHFENLGLTYLGSKEISFKCNCSRERMVGGLRSVIRNSGVDYIFAEDETEIELKCDYCNTSYLVKKNEFTH